MVPEDFIDPPDARVRRLTIAVVALLLVGLGACIAKGANEPSDPKLVRVTLDGVEFGRIAIRVDPAPNELRCALLAATEEQREHGLMRVTTKQLGSYAGMVFRFSTDSEGAFYMRNTPTPLSIAWFRADGSFISATDMAPCGDQPDCPTFAPPEPYRYALEVPQGQLPKLGIGPGSRLRVTAEDCPST